MKKNKLYTANRWNQPAFMVDRQRHNIFDGFTWGQSSQMNNNPFGINLNATTVNTPKIDWSNPVQRNMALGQTNALTSSFGSSNPINLQQSNQMLSKTISAPSLQNNNSNNGGLFGKNTWSKGGMGWAGAGMAASALGSINTGEKRGMWDTLDPVHHLAGGRESGAGNAMGDAGVALAQAGLSSGNPYLMLAGAGAKVMGGLINAAFGIKTDQARLNNINEGLETANNFVSDASTFDDIEAPISIASADGVYEGGWFSGGRAARKNAELKARRAAAVDWMDRSVSNNIYNITNDFIGTNMRNYAAFGGPLDTSYDDMGAVNYGFMSDYLTQKKRENDMKNKMSGLPSVPAFMPNSFAIGGDLQTNGGDFSDGLTIIGAGGSHSENPYEGVQLGTDENGTPNLVEENETVWNDYVFSNRILADAATKQLFKMPKKKDITYADISKRLEKEIAERPNDPISKSSFEKQMQMLEEQQERQKQEMEAERARAAFEALSPEEQTALMQQRAEQEAMAQQAAMQEAAAQQQPAMQPTPEEIAMAQQQQMMADGSEPNLGQEPQMNCMGGKINKFDKGGVLKFLNSLGYKTVAEAEKAGWKPSDFGNYNDWNDINSNSKLPDNFTWTDEFSKRLTSPEQKAMLSLGWNPTAALLGRKWYEGDNGNNVGWTESVGKDALNAEEFENYAKRYKNTLGWAVENGIIKAPEGNATIPMAEITKAMREAPDWKATDNWLYSDIANQAAYLGMARGLNPDNDTKFINRWSPYGSFTKGADGKWNYTLRDNLTDAEKQAFTDQFRRTRTDNKVGVMYNNFTDPGTVTNRYVLDENGTPVLLTGDDLSDYEEIGNYSWGDEANNVNNNAILYRAKGNDTDGNSENSGSGSTIDDRRIVPVHRNEALRYAGLFGPAVGLGMQMAGIGKPDTSGLDAALNISRGAPHLAKYKPIGNYLTYKPMDIWFEQNRNDANSRATDRTILNNSAPVGTRMAGLLANSYNNQIANGQLFRQALEYNDAQRKKVTDFNRATDMFNADAYNRLSQFNASARNQARQANAQLGLHAAAQKMNADAAWNSGIYGNVAGLFKGIGDLGRENYQHNRIADMAATGLFGTINPDTFVANGYLTWDDKKKRSNGGKINRKKGGRK